MAYKEERVNKFSGEIIGWIRQYDNGDQEAIEFPSRKVLGKYVKHLDHTTDFFGRKTSDGNTVISFLYGNKY